MAGVKRGRPALVWRALVEKVTSRGAVKGGGVVFRTVLCDAGIASGREVLIEIPATELDAVIALLKRARKARDR